MICPDVGCRLALFFGIGQRSRKRVAARAVDEFAGHALHALLPLMHFGVPPFQRGVADKKSGRVVQRLCCPEPARVIRDHKKIKRTVQLGFHPASRRNFFPTRKTQRLFRSKLYAKAKGVDGIGSMEMGIAPKQVIGGARRDFSVR